MAEILLSLDPEELGSYQSLDLLPRNVQVQAFDTSGDHLVMMKELYWSLGGEAIFLVEYPDKKLQAYYVFDTDEESGHSGQSAA